MASSCQREPIASRILSLFNRNASGSKVGDILPVVASTFFDVPNGMMYAWNVFRPFFSFSLSLSFSPILELTTSFFFSESFLFLKYKSMSWQCSCIMFFSIFFAKEGIIVFFSRKKSLLVSSILSLVDWDRKCSFPWKRMKIVALFLHEENK